MRVPQSNFTNKLHTWLVLLFLLIFIAVLVVPIELSRMSVHAQNNNAVPQQPYQTFDSRQTAQLNELYGKSQSGEQFSEEEKLILQRWGLGLPISELEGRVVISRVLYERYVANQELTLEAEGLLNEFESYRRAAGRLIEDERVKIKQEKSAQQETSQSQSSPLLVEAIPANDNCSGAIGITDTGTYPITTATVDAVSATTTGDPLFSCATVDDTIWYTFIPSQTSTYTITSCTAGTGSSDTVLGVFTASGVCSGFTQVAGGCSDTDFSCASNTESSTVNPLLAAGVTYYIVVGRSNFLPGSPSSVPIQLSISRPPSPVNDTCAGATPLALDIPLAGTTFAANKDYQLSGSSCFTGIGQTPVVADGRDVVYSFNSPATDDYSFRVTGLKNTNSDLVLYVTTSCPGPSTITCNNSSGPAIAAANRSFGTTAEEVMCVPLVGGQTYYLVVDEQQQSDGSAFTVEVNQCRREVEPNDLPGTAGTGTEGSIASATDVDFYQLGAPAVGSRAFALLDGIAANSTDFDMRVTTSTNTLEYDDKEADSQFGSLAPVIAGTPLTGVASYLRINHRTGLASEPYRLYRQIQVAGGTPLAACPSITTSATAETESNNSAASANTLPNNCQPPKICYYASGSIGSGDGDYFSFNATAGNLIFLAVDGNPCRDGTVSAFNPALELRDSLDAQLIRVNDTNSGLTCPAGTSICTAQAGLTATAPNSAGEALVYRARTTGTYYARVSQGASSAGNYLLSISLDQTVIPVQPALSISDVSQAEGNSGTTSFTFTVSLSAASSQTVTVQYATANGTATAGPDYQSTSGTLTFNPGQTSKPVTVLVNGDTTLETNETFLVNLAVPTNATFADTQGVGTIVNDDAPPTISINDISQGEGNSGTTSFTFTVGLSAASSQTVTVNYATANGTATAGSDYQSASGTLTFAPGDTSKPVTVLVNGDALNEGNETFLVNLTVPTNATISDSQGVGTITNDDAVAALSISDVGVTEGNSGTVSAGFTVSLSAATGQTVTVQYATANGTSTAGSDYQSTSGTLTFNAGETSKPVTVLVNGDTTFEVNETFFVNLTVPTNATIADSQGVGTIVNDDAQPTLSLNDISQGEGNSGTTSFTFTVSLSAASSQTVTVNYATANGTATAGSDYQSATGTLTFNAGETSKPVTVLVNGDALNEPSETFLVNLAVPTNATISDSQGVGTITNDDPVPSLSINDVGVTEGNSGTVSAGFTVSLSAASGQTVTVQYATANGTATAGSDYQSASGTLNFNAGETSKPVTVLVNGDNVNEPNETFLVNLTVPTNATIADTQGVGTILNDDGAPTLSVNDISHGEGNSSTTSFTFTVNLLPASDQTVTVAYATANGTATAGSDYQSTSGTLTFNAGETSKPVTVVVNGDTLNEANETFLVNLIVPTNAAISDNQGVGTITNDDAVPALSISDVGVTEGNSGTVSANFTVSLSAVSGQTVTVNYATANGTATAGPDYQSASGTLTFNPGETSKPLTVLVNGDTAFEADETFLVNLTVPTNATIVDNQGVGTIANDDAQPPANAVQFTATTASVTETANATTKVDLVVTRSGDSSGVATVDYASGDGTASERSDYLAALGTLRFAAGETAKSISVFIVDDVFGESAETFNVTLSNAVGLALGAPSSVTVTINSNESVNGLNPVKDASFNSDFFVRQHYVDFFNREADPGGLAFWKNQIDECTTQECKEVRRINVSAAFFISIEFQQTGYLVYKANQSAFNSGEFLRLREFLPDLQEIGRGVVIGQPGADAQLEANKQKYFLAFVQRAKFVDAAAYPTTMTAAQFVDKLNANTFNPLNPGTGALTQTERDALVGQLSAGPASPTLRAQVLRSVSENVLFSARQFNKAFVLMQYFGYLRRNPNDPPESGLDFAGYNFWLGKLNQFNGNFINAEMVKAFILSGEYQQRFGP